jgi:hypothetical protein
MAPIFPCYASENSLLRVRREFCVKELRDREIELARHAEQAYEQFVSQWQRRGNAKQRAGAGTEERR